MKTKIVKIGAALLVSALMLAVAVPVFASATTNEMSDAAARRAARIEARLNELTEEGATRENIIEMRRSMWCCDDEVFNREAFGACINRLIEEGATFEERLAMRRSVWCCEGGLFDGETTCFNRLIEEGVTFEDRLEMRRALNCCDEVPNQQFGRRGTRGIERDVPVRRGCGSRRFAG